MSTKEVLDKQKAYFLEGETRSVKFRKHQLERLRDAIKRSEGEIYKALKEDLGKTEIESYMCEVGLVLGEIKYLLKHLRGWAKPKKVSTPLANFPAKSFMMPCPKGNVLIMSPWNYPFMLTMEPLADCLAAGNTAIVKPSAYSPAVSGVVEKIIKETFDEKYVAVVTGGREVNQDLLSLKFNHIFFTGSKAVGHEVLKKAEPNMTTVTLELGGKSPCVVDKSAPIELAAKRIVFGKFLNCGQTCIAPDYVLVDKAVRNDLLKALVNEIKLQYGTAPLVDKDYGKMISQKHYEKAIKLLEKQKIFYGGKHSEHTLKIEPTIVYEPSLDSEIMKNEIFAPILPVVSYENEKEALDIIALNDTPLALYIFSKDKKNIKLFTENVQFGGGCINDTIMHIASSKMAFGGVGESGMGAYHGKRGFDTFSHYKSMIKKSLLIDVPLRYRPIGKKKSAIIKKFI